MKRMFIFAGVLFVLSCNDKKEAAEKTGTTVASASTEMPEFVYSIDKGYRDWSIGDQQNAANYLKGLKAWENNNMAESASYFGDSVDLAFDNYETRVSRDSLIPILGGKRTSVKDVRIKMHDWLPVISKDKSEEWVTAWYTEYITDHNGKMDSLFVIDDAKFKDGKIIRLEEATRRFQAKK